MRTDHLGSIDTRRCTNLVALVAVLVICAAADASAQTCAPVGNDDACFVSQHVPTRMVAGQQYTVSVTMRNTGLAWPLASSWYNLGSQNPQDNLTWGLGRVRPTDNVSQGAHHTFTFTVTAPSSPGYYNFQWRMLAEGFYWFGAYTPNVSIQVVDSPSVTLSTDRTAASFGDLVRVVATTAPAATSGTITFRHAGTDHVLGTQTVDADGTATRLLLVDGMRWSAGSNPIEAHYDGGGQSAVSHLREVIVQNTSGLVAMWGPGIAGQIGDGTRTPVNPQPVPDILSDVVALATGSSHTIALKEDGTVWTWGTGLHGQLGLGAATTVSLTPVQVITDANGNAFTDVVAIGTAEDHCLAIRYDGGRYTVWAWGWNASGQLGDNTLIDRFAPVQVLSVGGTGISGFVAISAGEHHSLALGWDGSVYAWGYGGDGALGDGNLNPHTVLGAATVFGFGPHEVTRISAGYQHSVALTADGSVYTWGRNGEGQLGIGLQGNQAHPQRVNTLPADITEIAAGFWFTLALHADSGVYTWGVNSRGQLGNGTTYQVFTAGHSRTVTAEGTVLKGVTQIAAGEQTSLYLRADGTVWTAGGGDLGQLGDGRLSDRLFAAATSSPVPFLRLRESGSTHHSGGIERPTRVSASGSATFGGAATFSAIVANGAEGVPAPGINVTFTVNGVTLATGRTDAHGNVTIAIDPFTAIDPGSYADALHVQYEGPGVRPGTATGALLVEKGTPSVDWRPRPLNAGEPVGPNQLNAAASVPGAFTFTPASGAFFPSGLHRLRASFAPADSARWHSVSGLTALLAVRDPNAPSQFVSRDLGEVGDLGLGLDIVGLNEAGQIAVDDSQRCWYFDGSAWHGLTLGGSACHVTDLSDHGTVVGFATTSSGATHAFTYADRRLTDLGAMSGVASWAWAVNNTGVIVGHYATTNGSWRAFVYENGIARDLAPDCAESVAVGVNDDGQVIGRQKCSGQWVAFRYSAGLFETLSADGPVEPQHINASGALAGKVLLPSGEGIFIQDGARRLSSSPVNGGTAVTDLNDRGEVVGFRGQGSAGYIATVDGVVDMTPLPGSTFSQPRSINNTGAAVGISNTPANLATGFLHVAGSTFDLNAVLTSDSDAAVVRALRINDAGVIAAVALVNGRERVVLLTPSRVATTLQVNAPSSLYGTPATLSAILTAADPIAGQTIGFSVDGTVVGTSITDATGTAVLAIGGSLDAGSHSVTANYAGEGAYLGSEASTILTITPATVAISVDALRSVYDGTAKPVAATSIPAVPLTITYDGRPNAPTNAGVYAVAVTVADRNYVAAPVLATLTIDKARPQVTWPAPEPIVYGTPLPASSFDATANVAGAFIYSHQVGDILPGGSHHLTLSFTPDDTANYEILTPAPLPTTSAHVTADRAPFTGDEESICGGCERRPYDTTGNLAYQGNGFARAAVGDNEAIAEYTHIHRAEFLNDGRYGHGTTHLTGFPGWVKVDLGREAWIARVRLGRDRLGYHDDRDPHRILLYASSNDANYANGDSSDDEAEYVLVLDSWAAGLDADLAFADSVEISLPDVRARYLKFQFAGSSEAAAIDEIEVFGSVTQPVHGPSVTQVVDRASPRLSIEGGSFRFNGRPHAASVTATGVYDEPLGPVEVHYSTGQSLPTYAGTYEVTASFAGNDNYVPASVTATLTIAPAGLVVRAVDASRPYGSANPAFAVSYQGLVDGESAEVLTGTLTFATTATPQSPAGEYPVTPSGLAATNYDVVFEAGTLAVMPATPTVSITALGPYTYDAKPHTAVGAVNGVFGETLGEVALTYDGSPHPPVNAGSYAVVASYGGSGNYEAASASGVLTINPAGLRVSADNQTRSYGAGNPPFTATYQGFADGDSTAVLDGTLAFSTAATEESQAGDYEIVPSGLSSGNYAIAFAPGTLSITPALPTLTIQHGGPFVYDALPHGLTASLVGVFGEDLGPTSITYGGSGEPPIAAGTYAVEAAYAGSQNYLRVTAAATLRIDPAPLVVTATAATRPYGHANPVFGATVAGFAGDDTVADLSGTLVFTTSATPSSHVGDYAIVPDGLTSTNYTVSFVAGTLHVVPSDSTTALATSANPSGHLQPIQLTATVGMSGAAVIGAPIGLVQFLNQGVLLGSASLVDGRATLSVVLQSGTHVLSAVYAGNTDVIGSTGAMTQTVNPRQSSTKTVVRLRAEAVRVGQPVSIDIRVMAQRDQAEGVVHLFDGEAKIATLTLVRGQAHFKSTNFTVGVHEIRAEYPGSAAHPASVSVPEILTVFDGRRKPSQSHIDMNPDPRRHPAAVEIEVSGGLKAPTGSVLVWVDGRPAGSFVLASDRRNRSTATVPAAGLTSGWHVITAVYLGDGQHAGAARQMVIQVR